MRLHGLAVTGIVTGTVGGLLFAGLLDVPAARAFAAQDQVIIQQGGAPPSAGRGPVPDNLAFEAASVKPNKSGGNQVSIGIQPGGRFNAVNVPLRFLIRNAYQLQDFQLVGGPGWVATDRFDVIAKAEGDLPPAPPGTAGPVQIMLRNLMADRFKLRVHRETREMPIYALVLARADGRLGPRLTPSTVDCAARGRARGGAPPAIPLPTDRPVCGMRTGPGSMAGGGFPLSQLAASLSPFAQRIVIDRTGLTGNFDLDLTWTPDQIPQGGGGPGGLPAGVPPPPPIDPNGPSLFTAVQEQLGLKLESVRGPVDVLVIDSVEQPSAD